MTNRAVRTINKKKKSPIKKALSSSLGKALTIGFNKHAFKLYSRYYQRSGLFECIEIETINRCNNSCAFCPVSIHADTRPFHKMDEKLFHKIIDELSDYGFTDRIAFYSNNEPYLDDRLIPWIRYAREKCPGAFFFIYTNGILLDTQKIIQTLDAGIDQIVINHYNDDLVPDSRLLEIIKNVDRADDADYRKKITIFIRRKNEIRSNRGGNSPNKDTRHFRDYLLLRDIGCPNPFRQMVVRPTGEVSLCCNDALGKVTLGDIRRQTLREIWFGPRFQEIRRELLSNGRKNLEICCVCDTMLSLREFKIIFHKIAGSKIDIFSRTY